MTTSNHSAPPEPEHLGWQRDFTWLWRGSAASQLGSMSAASVGPLLALTLTRSPVYAGWVTAAAQCPNILMPVPAGWLTDRYSGKRVMLISQICRFTVVTLFLVTLFISWKVKTTLIATVFLSGAFTALYNIAEAAAVPSMVPSSALPEALTKNEARPHIARLASRPLGGFLLGINRVAPFLVDLFAGAATIFALLKVDWEKLESIRERQPPDKTRKARISTGLKGVARDPILRTIILACTVGNFCFQILFLLLIVRARDQGISNSLIGLLLVTSSVGSLAGTVVAPLVLKRFKPRRLIQLCLWTWVALTCCAVAPVPPAMGLCAWGLVSFVGGHLNLALSNHQATYVPSYLLGRVMGINRLLTAGTLPLGSLFAGYAIARSEGLAAVAVVTVLMTQAILAPRLLDSILPDRAKDWLDRRSQVEEDSATWLDRKARRWKTRAWDYRPLDRSALEIESSRSVSLEVLRTMATPWQPYASPGKSQLATASSDPMPLADDQAPSDGDGNDYLPHHQRRSAHVHDSRLGA